MAALKWIVVVVCGLGGVGALGMGFLEGAPRAALPAATTVAVALRPLPEFPGGVALAQAPTTPPAEKASEPVAKAPEPAKAPEKAPEPVAKTPEPQKAPEPVARPPEPVAKTPEPEKAPEPVAKTPEAAPKPPAPKPPPAAAPAGEGTLNLRATDTADVYVDGKKVGGSPVLGFTTKSGSHRVRFDCYDAAGNAIAGPVKMVTVKPDEEQDVEFPCPEPE